MVWRVLLLLTSGVVKVRLPAPPIAPLKVMDPDAFVLRPKAMVDVVPAVPRVMGDAVDIPVSSEESVAPPAMVMEAAAPVAPVLFNLSVPAVIAKVPVNAELLPLMVNVPLALLLSVPAPLIEPLSVWAAVLLYLNVEPIPMSMAPA